MNNYERLNLYPHNIKTCKKVKEAFDSGEQIVSIIKATGTGKSYIGLNLALEHKNEKIVWLVPTLSIKEHIEKTINNNPNISMDNDFPNLEIRTYSSLVNMTKKEIENIPCDLLIVDELHHLGAPVWGERVNYLVESHSDMRVFGMSAYSVRDRGTAYERDMVNPDTEELFSNTVVDRYDLYDAIIDGILPMPFVKSVLVENSKMIQDLREAQKLKRIQGKPIYYEIDKIIDSITKTIHKQAPVKEIVQKNVKEDGKYIYFCPVISSFGNNDIDSIMKQMEEYLSLKFPNKKIVFYKTTSEMGENGKYNRECFYHDVDLDGNDVSNTIRIMFAKNQYNEGVHAPNVDGVFLGRETGSDIVALEQIGRALSVRGETSKKIAEYNKYSLEEIKEIAKTREIIFNEDMSKEYLIELLTAPTIIDLADNIDFLKELETNLKDRVRERKEKRTLNSRQIKMLETWSILDVVQTDLYKALLNLREQVASYTWDEWYSLAAAYYKYHGNSEIPSHFKTKNGYEYDEIGLRLGQWCVRQRVSQNKLTEEQKQKLKQIEFRFETDLYEIKWQQWYSLATAYYKYYGNSEIPSSFKTKNGYEYDETGIKLGQWCGVQRSSLDKMSEERKQKLKQIEFRFETDLYEIKWQQWYSLATAYYKYHGNSEIPSSFKTNNGIDYDETGIKLGKWCEVQRRDFDKMSEERKQKLQQIEFRFETDLLETRWQQMYELALEYYKRNGNSEIPGNFKTNNGYEYDETGIKLGQWCGVQRSSLDKMSEERKQKLQQIEFRFDNNLRDLNWSKMYELALEYYKRNGNSEIPANFKTKNGYEYDETGIKLGQWCVRQRESQNKLTEERKQKLKQIGFRFQIKNNDKAWEEWYILALEYYKHNGNLEIPINFKTKNGYEYSKDGKKLYQWFHNQRMEQEKLSEERKQKLEQIGFRFKIKNNDKAWEEWYILALAYYKRNGNSEIPSHFKTKNGYEYDETGVTLGTWCLKQRSRQNTLSEERRKKLELIEFRFESKKNNLSWEEWYILALEYYKRNGNSEIPGNFKTKNGYEYDETGVTLGTWYNRQRTKENTLSEERRKKLELIEYRFATLKDNEEKKKQLCNQNGLSYQKYKFLKRMSYQELYAKIEFLKDNNYSLEINNNLHEIFYMSNENMIIKYMISKEELITQYYINRKGRRA